jgi:hypothetical protein
MDERQSLGALFVASFNRDLDALNCPARVALPSTGDAREILELHDAEGHHLCAVPESTAPDMVAIAYRLYVQGLRRGLEGGEQAAWAKLRFLIGAAADLAD